MTFISLLFLLLAPLLVEAGPAGKEVPDKGFATAVKDAVPVSSPEAELVQGSSISLPGLPAPKTTQRLLAFAEDHDLQLRAAAIGLLLKESARLYLAFNNHLFFIYPSHNFW